MNKIKITDIGLKSQANLMDATGKTLASKMGLTACEALCKLIFHCQQELNLEIEFPTDHPLFE